MTARRAAARSTSERDGARALGRRPPKGEATRERILDAAEAVFGEKGLHDASLQEIAAAANAGRPSSITYHFGSKEGLFEETVRRLFAAGMDDLVAAMRVGGTRDERIAAVIGAFRNIIVGSRRKIALQALIEVMSRGIGASVLADTGRAMLDLVEQFVRHARSRPIAPGAPVRDALLQLAAAEVVRAGMESRVAGIWEPVDRMPELAAALFRSLEEWPAAAPASEARADRDA